MITGMLVSAASAFFAGFVQGIGGFGAGIIMMLFLPSLMTVPQAAGVVCVICIPLCFEIVWQYRKHIRIREALLPAIPYCLISIAFIRLSTKIDVRRMRALLGIFLALLSAYHLFAPKKADREIPPAAGAIMIALSGVFEGMFGIGGPLMVLWFMNRLKDHETYLATIQFFFGITMLPATVFRICAGILGAREFSYAACGIAAILAGGLLAKKTTKYLSPPFIERAVYVLVGLSGLLNAAQALLPG